MPRKPTREQEYRQIMGYREGARYCKMDLHTHGPASECSSYRLPAAMEAAFPPKPKSKGKRQQRYDFLVGLARGDNPFKGPYASKPITSLPRLAGPPPLDKTALQRIAAAWLKEIRTFYPEDPEDPTAEQVKRRDDLVTRAIRDVECYLMSLFFPEEYVLRCYIEGLQLVALTDHNYPGEIVLRLPRLGTWFSHLQAVNAAYAKEVSRGDPTGKVRKTIVARLQAASRALGSGDGDEIRVTSEIKRDHKDKRKKLSGEEQRKLHVAERLAYWRDKKNPLLLLTLLPGVEITASNVHLLCVFPPAWYVSGRIGGILRTIGIPEEHWGRGFYAAALSSVQDTITRVDAEGGVVIPAHANSDHKGLMRLFRSGLALTRAIEHPALLALETIGGTVRAGKSGKRGMDACDTLRWLDIGSGRPTRSKPLCFIKSSDSHEARIDVDGVGEDLGSRFTYVKLDIRKNDTADEVFRSLRLALMSGQSRVIEFPWEDGYNYTARNKKQREAYVIKRADREALLDCQRRRPTVLGITVSGERSYARDMKIRLNPFLNCVIGSGGKSTFVRMVGYAFGKQKFFPSSPPWWLPEQVRVFWQLEDQVFCVQRTGRHYDPEQVEVKCFRLAASGRWQAISESRMPDPDISVWPSPEVQDGETDLSKFEDEVISELVANLEFRASRIPGPLLVNQPKDIFNTSELFQRVLAKPHFKFRQIIWSTGSPNVPTALDAEKIIVTTSQSRPKKMKMVCAGDLHEDEIREQMFDHFEGGPMAFDRRVSLYSL